MGGPASSIGDECFVKPGIQEQVGILQCITATQIPAHAGSSVEYFLIGSLKRWLCRLFLAQQM
jgi:hypothetical protein